MPDAVCVSNFVLISIEQSRCVFISTSRLKIIKKYFNQLISNQVVYKLDYLCLLIVEMSWLDLSQGYSNATPR